MVAVIVVVEFTVLWCIGSNLQHTARFGPDRLDSRAHDVSTRREKKGTTPVESCLAAGCDERDVFFQDSYR